MRHGKKKKFFHITLAVWYIRVPYSITGTLMYQIPNAAPHHAAAPHHPRRGSPRVSGSPREAGPRALARLPPKAESGRRRRKAAAEGGMECSGSVPPGTYACVRKRYEACLVPLPVFHIPNSDCGSFQ